MDFVIVFAGNKTSRYLSLIKKIIHAPKQKKNSLNLKLNQLISSNGSKKTENEKSFKIQFFIINNKSCKQFFNK